MEIVIILSLIVVNGIFAMAEIAIISARKSRLQQRASEGNRNAQAVLDIAKSPSRFLSTVQIGITLVGIFAGAFGGATIAEDLAEQFQNIPPIAPYSETIALIIVVSVITYLSLIIGELVPKRLALSNPEKIAMFVAQPMNKLSAMSSPIVSLLSTSTDWMLKIFGIKDATASTISDEDIRILLREGTLTGEFDETETDIVERTMKLSDKKVNSLMTPRKEIVWLDIDSPFKTLRNKITKKPHSFFPVCRDNLDKIIGVIRTENLLVDFLSEEKINLKKLLHKPLFIPESMDGLKVLELFKKSGVHMALIADEYGNTQGLISLTDILEEIVGDIPAINEFEEEEIVRRDNGTFLVDGLVSIEEFKSHFRIKRLPGERTGIYHTVGGFITHKIGHIPASGESFELGNFKFEVIDMDGNRVDKVLTIPIKKKVI